MLRCIVPVFFASLVLSTPTYAQAPGQTFDETVSGMFSDQRAQACTNGDRGSCLGLRFGNCGHADPRRSIPACTRMLTSPNSLNRPSGAMPLRLERTLIYVLRADSYSKRGELDHAIEDYDHALTTYGENASWILGLRAIAYRRAGKYDEAASSYDAAIALKPEDANGYLAKAWLHNVIGQYRDARSSYDEALGIEPENPVFLIARAWFLATAPDDEVRDGQQAIVDALTAIGLVSNIPPVFLDALAAAYAESGDFEKAIEIEEWVLALLVASPRKSNVRAIEIYQTRLDLYLQEMPFREISCASITLGDAPPYCQFELDIEGSEPSRRFGN